MKKPTAPASPNFHETVGRRIFRNFIADRAAVAGVVIVALLLIPALGAPLIANGRPLLMRSAAGEWSMPFLREFFAPEGSESLIESVFNYGLLLLPCWGIARLSLRRSKKWRHMVLAACAALLLIPFCTVRGRLDRTEFRDRPGCVFAPIPYGPAEQTATPYEKPSLRHWLGTDEIGRDVASRMIYGARISLAVGVLATALALLIGTVLGLLTGYFQGLFDLTVMRVVEIVMCFPTFLLLLILMSILRDWKCEQSVLIVILVLGLSGWIGLCLLVRGEVFKQRSLPYIAAAEGAGLPLGKILFGHLLPNVLPVILISGAFSVAGSILAESSLSFLGFGVQPPTASWGGLLRQAFDSPFEYWHLTLFPGLALFGAILAFNFIGEGLRKAAAPAT